MDVTLASCHTASLHMCSDPPAAPHTCLLPALSPVKWKETLLQHILKRSHEHTQVCPGDKSHLPLCWVGWTAQFPKDWCRHTQEGVTQYLKLLSGHSHCRTILCLLAIQENTQVSLHVFQEKGHQSASKAEIQTSVSVTGVSTQYLHQSSFSLSLA